MRRVRDRALLWLRRRGLLDERSLEERSNEAPELAALDGCAAIALYRGTLSMLPASEDEADGSSSDADGVGAARSAFAVERDGFHLHEGVRWPRRDALGDVRAVVVKIGALDEVNRIGATDVVVRGDERAPCLAEIADRETRRDLFERIDARGHAHHVGQVSEHRRVEHLGRSAHSWALLFVTEASNRIGSCARIGTVDGGADKPLVQPL